MAVFGAGEARSIFNLYILLRRQKGHISIEIHFSGEGKYLYTLIRCWRSIYIHFDGDAGEVFIVIPPAFTLFIFQLIDWVRFFVTVSRLNGCQAERSFIHSGYFYSASSSPQLLRCVPDTARILCRIFMPKRLRQLLAKDVPKIPKWRLERESNARPLGR